MGMIDEILFLPSSYPVFRRETYAPENSRSDWRPLWHFISEAIKIVRLPMPIRTTRPMIFELYDTGRLCSLLWTEIAATTRPTGRQCADIQTVWPNRAAVTPPPERARTAFVKNILYEGTVIPGT